MKKSNSDSDVRDHHIGNISQQEARQQAWTRRGNIRQQVLALVTGHLDDSWAYNCRRQVALAVLAALGVAEPVGHVLVGMQHTQHLVGLSHELVPVGIGSVELGAGPVQVEHYMRGVEVAAVAAAAGIAGLDGREDAGS